MAKVIDIRGLHKSFGSTHALDGLDLAVATGEVHGFLGPNGAGKSTTIRVLLGLLRADAGTVRLFGGDPWRDAAALHRRLAYVPGDVNLWPNLYRRRGHRPARPAARRARRAAARRPDRAVRARPHQEGPRLLQGQPAEGRPGRRARLRRRAALLDEPTSGLDPLMEAVFTECIDEFKDDGRHGAAVQPHPGRGRAAVRPGEHHPRRPHRRDRHAGRPAPPHPHVRLGRAGAPSPPGSTALAGVHDLVVEGNRVHLRGRHRPPRRGASTRSGGFGIRTLTSQPPTLEELFLRHYGDEVAARMTGPHDRHSASCCARSRGATGWMLLWWIARRAPSSTGPRRVSVDGLYTTQAEFDKAAASMEDNAAFIAMAGPARALNTTGGQVAWQSTGVRRDPRRADEHVPRRPAHPRRGGVRPRRAAPRRAPSAGRRR